ncbi:hypothetical protein DL765_002655 [Monosporascus sp. GIB2]|nr:hypothetical protein DL765_002655 [Monosporascus sp. GIB2]
MDDRNSHPAVEDPVLSQLNANNAVTNNTTLMSPLSPSMEPGQGPERSDASTVGFPQNPSDTGPLRPANIFRSSPSHEFHVENPVMGTPTHFQIREDSAGTPPVAPIGDRELRSPTECSRLDTGMDTSSREPSRERNNYDADVILAYQQLSTALQAAEDADAAEQASTGIIIADDASATDAGYVSDAATTASTSITSSIWNHSFENGRRYHKFREGAYHFPNDDIEQEREDMKHSMVKMLCHHKLHFAPIGPNPQEILDIGTGTGSWAIEMGEIYPSASVLGIDLSPIQPDWVPPNVRFMVDDVESPWLHPLNHFDYIHSRHTVMAIKDWGSLLRRCYEHTRPGGWIELQEIYHFPMSNNNPEMPRYHPVAQYWRHVDEGLKQLGVDFRFSSGGQIAELMRQRGFTGVAERVFHVPIGTWPQNKMLKSVGVYWKTILLDGLQAIALRPLMRGLRWDRDHVEAFLVSVRKAYHDNSCQMFMPLICVYGQKPLNTY